MSQELLTSSRMFQLWDYTVGHKQLLLRSTKSESSDSRIDIYFKDVGAICLLTGLGGVIIREAADIGESKVYQELADDVLSGRRLFLIESTNFRGFIVAATVAWHEDNGEYDAPSFFKLRHGEG